MLLCSRWGIDLRHSDPILDEALTPSPQVIGSMGCSAWGDGVWLTHGALSVGREESVDPMCSEAKCPGDCSSSSIAQSPARPMLSPEELLVFDAGRMMGALGRPDVLVEPPVGVCGVVAKATQTKATPLSLEDSLTKVTCALPQPLLGTPAPLHGEKDDGRQSGRLEKKNKVCNILTSKCAEHRLLETFSELPEVSEAEGPKQKMKAYLDMYKKPLSPQVIKALRTLASIAEKVKVEPFRMFST